MQSNFEHLAGQQEPAKLIVSGLALSWSEPEKAYYYSFPGTGMKLFYDTQNGIFLPAAGQEQAIFRERTAATGSDGSKFYKETVILRDVGSLTESDLEQQVLLIRARAIEFRLKIWENLVAWHWVVPFTLVAMFVSFAWAVSKVMNGAAAKLAGQALGAALAEVFYYGTWFLGILGAVLVCWFLLPLLFKRKAITSSLFEEPSPTTAEKQGGGVVVNIQQTDALSQTSQAQNLLNQR